MVQSISDETLLVLLLGVWAIVALGWYRWARVEWRADGRGLVLRVFRAVPVSRRTIPWKAIDEVRFFRAKEDLLRPALPLGVAWPRSGKTVVVKVEPGWRTCAMAPVHCRTPSASSWQVHPVVLGRGSVHRDHRLGARCPRRWNMVADLLWR
ncbi:MAG TPA: hypothetical protein VD838_06660 [Anaeromyxobacteraceae bacterium]|nr:hypothetical protein [Anaeromyxobacteraceae bacterium]